MRLLILFTLALFTSITFAQNVNLATENELIPFKMKDKWGAATLSGKMKISAKYDNLSPFFHNVTRVEKEEKFGVINTKNKVVVPIIYDEVTQMIYSNTSGISYVCKKDEKVMLQVGKKVLVPLSEGYGDVSIVVDSNHNESYYILSKKKGTVFKYTVINSTGKKILENVIGDELKFITVAKKEKNNFDFPELSAAGINLTKRNPDFYWWSEASKEVTSEKDIQRIIEGFEYGGYNDDEEFDFMFEYKTVSDFRSCYLFLKKKLSRNSTSRAFYTVEGKEVFKFSDKVEKMYFMTEDLALVKTYDDELNCKRPTKYGVYNLKTKRYSIEPNYYFYRKKSLNIRSRGFDKNMIEVFEKVCENLDEIKQMQKDGYPDHLIEKKAKKMFGIEDLEPEKIIVLASETDIKILSEEGDLIKETTITEGEFIPNDLFAIKSKDSIYVGIEVFNDNYRGKGIMNINTNEVVVKPIYERLRKRYDNTITLYGDEMEPETIKNFEFPINDKTAKIAEGFVRALSGNLYLVSKDEDKVAVYNVSMKKNITKYVFDQEFDYPRIKKIEKKEYVFVRNTDGSYAVMNDSGKVLASSSEDEIEVIDIYQNGKFYFITTEGYYGMDGTKYFK